jgi:nucleoporin NDC1
MSSPASWASGTIVSTLSLNYRSKLTSPALWLWFPIGPTGVRTLTIFLPALIIYVLRVAQWHVGDRLTETRADTVVKYTLRKATLATFGLYAFSAWIFSEVYIWSRPASSKLGLTDFGRANDRLKLNERPLFLRYLFLVLAVAQSAVHLWDDYDSIHVPALKPKKDRGDDSAAAVPVRTAMKPRQILLKKLPSIFATSLFITCVSLVLGGLVYFMGPRHLVWEYYYSFHRTFISLSKTSKPTGVAPFLPLVWGFVGEGTMLVALWHFVNKAFDLYIAQDPLKNDNPITSDSKDPNGTLLNGLKSKKDAVKVCIFLRTLLTIANLFQAIAFWELALITDAFPERRKTLFAELERKKAPTFKQVTDLCLAEIKFLIERLSIGLDPAYTPPPTTGPKQPTPPVQLVPQISKPLQGDKQVTAAPLRPSTRWEHAETAMANIAKSNSAPGNAQRAYSREAINKGMQKAQEGKQQAESLVKVYYNKLAASYIGWPFRRSFERDANLVVLGTPYSRISLICNAITALTNLATFSLKEDALGRFHEAVPQIIRSFTTAIKMIDAYMATTGIHWSDYETLKKPEAERKKAPKVSEVRECLREGLERILGSFNEFLGPLNMSALEIMEAKKAAGIQRRQEMLQAAPR